MKAKTGGRKKGTPNKASQDLKARADELGVSPFDILLYFASGNWEKLGYDGPSIMKSDVTGGMYEVPRITLDQRLKAAADACQYLHPKRKSIEGKIDLEIDRPLEDLTDEELDGL